MAGNLPPRQGLDQIAGPRGAVHRARSWLNPELTAAKTLLINAVMMGLTPKEARDRFDAVIEFAEIEEFIDLKVKKTTPPGMQVRLAFSTMVQSTPT